MKCYKCKENMEESVDLVIHNGKTYTQRVMKCKHCGNSVVPIDEYEKIRKEIYPSLLTKLKSFFKSGDTKVVDLFDGKLL